MGSHATRLLFIAVLLSCASVFAFSIEQTETTPQNQAPEQQTRPSETPSQPLPEDNSSNTSAAPPNQQATPANPPAPKATPATPAPKPPVLRHRKHKSTAKKGSTAKNSNGEPNKIVVRNGGEDAKSAQLSPAITPAQAQHQRASAETLLAATNANLKRITGRQLTKEQQATLDEIRTYMRQAKAAVDSGDTNRAHTLAYKARLLSDELAPK